MALDCSSVQCLLTGVSISAVLCIIIVYKAIIYPRLLSPLRHLPSPEVCFKALIIGLILMIGQTNRKDGGPWRLIFFAGKHL
jgi:hypothetical protein